MLKIGIVGLPNVGKSTLFKALTQKPVTIANYPFATIDPNIAVVEVPDERLYKLAELSHSHKTIPTAIEFADIAGLVKGAAHGLGLGNAFLSHIRDADAILHLVRVFADPNIIHIENGTDPQRDLEIINMELVLKDLEIVSRALEKAESDSRSGDKTKIRRRETLEKIKRLLAVGKLLHFDLTGPEELRLCAEIGLLTHKPILVVFNISEQELNQNWQPDARLKEALGSADYLAIPVGLEAEAADIHSASEQKEFYEIAGIKETGLNNLIKKCYEVLGLITFFTTGEDETRAWTIPAGAKAPRAGRAIHSDFEEKFIRAEVIHWSQLLECGSWAKARELGQLRLEGKEYAVNDGEVIEFKI